MEVDYSNIEVATKWGKPAVYPLIKHSAGAKTVAIVFPGQAYTHDAPLMWYVEKAVVQSGCDVLGIEYGFQANRSSFSSDDFPDLISEVIGSLQDFFEKNQYDQIVFIAKSLGSVVSLQVMESMRMSVQKYIFLTPLPYTIPYLQKAIDTLVVVGNKDPLFGLSDIDQISGLPGVNLHVLEKADHLLEVSGDYKQSLVYLQQVAVLCGEFCK